MMKVVNYINEAFEELRSNVTWTSWSEVQRYAIIVAVFSLVMAVATWGIDEFFAKTIEMFFNWLNS